MKTIIAATFALALAFTLSCSGDDGGSGAGTELSSSSDAVPESSSSNGTTPSSSSNAPINSSSSGNGAGSSSSSGGTNPSSSSNGQSSSSSSVSGSSSSAEAASSSSSSADAASSSSSQAVGNSSSSNSIIIPTRNHVDTAYAFECNIFEAGDCNSTDFDKLRIDINGTNNKVNSAEYNARNSMLHIEYISPTLANNCTNREDIIGVVVDVQADLTFMEVAPIVGAGAPAEKSTFVESVKNLSDVQFRIKMDSVAATYPKNTSTGKRQAFRYNILIQEEGFEWTAVRHIRHTNCSTDFQELCSEDTAGNLKGARVSLFTCVSDMNWADAQSKNGLFTAPLPFAFRPMIPVYRVK